MGGEERAPMPTRSASRTRSCSATAAGRFERKYETRSVVDGRYVSIVRSDYDGYRRRASQSAVDTILWDRSADKRISIRPFFTETADNGPT